MRRILIIHPDADVRAALEESIRSTGAGPRIVEWAASLADEIRRAQAAGDPDTGETYYRHWLASLEKLIAAKGITSSETMHRYRDAWDHAADRTPHGQPIELRPEDFR